MKRRRLSALVVLFVAIFASWWGISVLTKEEVKPSAFIQGNTNVLPYIDAKPIVVHHHNENGVHTYSGTVTLSSACDTLGSGIAVSGANAHITVLLSYLVPVTACAAAAPMQPTEEFSTSITFENKKNPVFDGITINGVIAPFSLVED